MAQSTEGPEAPDKLETLKALLDAAAALVAGMSGTPDPLFARLVHVFAGMPAEDRGPILAVLEREVERRLRAQEPSETLTGFHIVRPNPNAQLYICGFGPPPIYHNRDAVMRATLRAARLLLLSPRDSHDEWVAATLEAFAVLAPEERTALAQHNRDMLGLLERFERQATAKAS